MNSAFAHATYYTKSVGVGVIAALFCYGLNTSARKYVGRVYTPLFSPVVEELLKTLPALVLPLSLLTVHTAFGVVEAIIDARLGMRPTAASALAVLTHLLFGVVTAVGWQYYDIYTGLSASVLLHMLWNSVVYDLVNLQRKD